MLDFSRNIVSPEALLFFSWDIVFLTSCQSSADIGVPDVLLWNEVNCIFKSQDCKCTGTAEIEMQLIQVFNTSVGMVYVLLTSVAFSALSYFLFI